MTAYIIIEFTPKNTEKLKQYGSEVPAILAKYSGEYLLKGKIEQLHGETSFKMQVVLTFPDRERALSWYHSDAYQALIDIRDAGMDSNFRLVGE